MDDPIYDYFNRNIEAVSKEQLLEALRSALESARCWRAACLQGFHTVRVNAAPVAFPLTGDTP